MQSNLFVYFIWLEILFLGGFRLHHSWIWVDSSNQIQRTFKADKDFGMLITWE